MLGLNQCIGIYRHSSNLNYGGSVVNALASQPKGKGSFPVVA